MGHCHGPGEDQGRSLELTWWGDGRVAHLLGTPKCHGGTARARGTWGN